MLPSVTGRFLCRAVYGNVSYMNMKVIAIVLSFFISVGALASPVPEWCHDFTLYISNDPEFSKHAIKFRKVYAAVRKNN